VTIQNLAQLTQQIADEYTSSRSYKVPAEQISLTVRGFLSTGMNEFPLKCEASEQLARLLRLSVKSYLMLDADLRAEFFNRHFRSMATEAGFGRDIRIHLDGNGQVVGYDDPRLLRITPIKLMDAVNRSLPGGLSPEQIGVSRYVVSQTYLHLSLFSPEKVTEPRPSDFVNGGVDIVHYTTGELGTQVHCYLRRMICSNGAIAHVCDDNKQIRARRLRNGRFDEADMLRQIASLFTRAWRQIDGKLSAISSLLNEKRVSVDFLRQQRARFSLNNRILRAIERAIREDEIGPTGTQYDWFNALSRIATHDEQLTFRQSRTLSRVAGEFSQNTVHRCSQCGSWVVREN
jgi:hypothetical protein